MLSNVVSTEIIAFTIAYPPNKYAYGWVTTRDQFDTYEASLTARGMSITTITPSRLSAAVERITKLNHIYILENPKVPGEYKVGSHRGTEGRLASRYKTAIPGVRILFFHNYRHAVRVEMAFHKKYRERCVTKPNGGKTEWYKWNLEDIRRNLLAQITEDRGDPPPRAAVLPDDTVVLPLTSAVDTILPDCEEVRRDTIRIDQMMAFVSFFTPLNIHNHDVGKKCFTTTVLVYGKQVKTQVTIRAYPGLDLPTVVDQNLHFAFITLFQQRCREEERVVNPFKFRACDLFRLIPAYQTKPSIKDYLRLEQWLKKMTTTVIDCDCDITQAGNPGSKLKFGPRVFNEYHPIIKDDGEETRTYSVHISEWHVDNMRDSSTATRLDLDLYNKLDHIMSKALVPLIGSISHLAVDSIVRIPYAEICDRFLLKRERTPYKKKIQMKTSLDELVVHSFVVSWTFNEDNTEIHIRLPSATDR